MHWTGLAAISKSFGGQFALVAAVLLSACAQEPPEQALRRSLAGLQEAIKTRDAATLQGYLAEDFIGPDGLDREGARRLATLHLMRHGRIGLALGPLDVEIRGQHATVSFNAATTGGEGRLIPDSGQVYAVDTAWRLRGGSWLMTSADWKRRL